MKWQICTLSHQGVFGCTKSEAGYLRVWEGHGQQWFLLGEFCIVATKEKNKSHANATMVVLGYFCKFCLISRDNCQKLSRLDIKFTKVINTKQDFEKKSTTHLG